MIKTKGIVVNFFKYKETSIIAKIFTEASGLKSYLIPNVRITNSKTPSALFHILNVLDLVVHNKINQKLQYIKEIKPIYLSNLNSIESSAIAMIIADILNNILKEDVQYENIFQFILQTALNLRIYKDCYEIYLLKFLIYLTKYIGYEINDVEELDIQIQHYNSNYKLTFIERKIISFIINLRLEFSQDLNINQRGNIYPLIESNEKNMYLKKIPVNEFIKSSSTNDPKLNNTHYSIVGAIITKILEYYKLHCSSIREIKTFKVYKEVFR